MKTVSDYARAYCDWLIDHDEFTSDDLHKKNTCDDIPDEDAAEMGRSGIEWASASEYWDAYNARLSERIDEAGLTVMTIDAAGDTVESTERSICDRCGRSGVVSCWPDGGRPGNNDGVLCSDVDGMLVCDECAS